MEFIGSSLFLLYAGEIFDLNSQADDEDQDQRRRGDFDDLDLHR